MPWKLSLTHSILSTPQWSLHGNWESVHVQTNVHSNSAALTIHDSSCKAPNHSSLIMKDYFVALWITWPAFKAPGDALGKLTHSNLSGPIPVRPTDPSIGVLFPSLTPMSWETKAFAGPSAATRVPWYDKNWMTCISEESNCCCTRAIPSAGPFWICPSGSVAVKKVNSVPLSLHTLKIVGSINGRVL